MSRKGKIELPSNNIRCELSDLFHTFLSSRKVSKRNKRFVPCGIDEDDLDDEEIRWYMQQGFVFDGPEFYDNDDDYDDDDCSVIWPPSKSKKGKKHHRKAEDIYDAFWKGISSKGRKRKHRKGKRARVIDINEPYSGEEEYPMEVDGYDELDGNDGIYDGKEIYYYPDYHEKESRLEFSTLKSFNDFCEDNGYTIPEHVANEIMYRRISHTCLRSDAKEYGMYEIMAEESYGTMVYEACDLSEIGNL